MKSETQAPYGAEIFESLEMLDIYLETVRERRRLRRDARMEAERLNVARGRVLEELERAREDTEPDIVTELEGVLYEIERRLQSAGSHISAASSSDVVPAISVPCVAIAADGHAQLTPETTPELLADFKPGSRDSQGHTPDLECAIAAAAMEPSVPEQELECARDVIPVSDSEADAWRSEADAIGREWAEVDALGLRLADRMLNRPACFRARALACELRRLQTLANGTSAEMRVEEACIDLLDKMELARAYACDFPAFPFGFDAARSDIDGPTADDWADLARIYRAVALAQDAWDWCRHQVQELGAGVLMAMLNAIAAAQQMLFVALTGYAGTDRLQMELFGSLRDAAAHVGFIAYLGVGAPWDELEQQAGAIPALLEKARKDAGTHREKVQKEAARALALRAMLDWQDEGSMQDLSETAVEAKRARLLPLLKACLAAGVPPTNVELRGRLLNAAPVLLAGLPEYARVLDAVLLERKRKGLDVVMNLDSHGMDEEEDLPDSAVTQSTACVRLLVDGQKVLVLGGTPRAHVVSRLKERLNCERVEWPAARKGDRMNKFRAAVLGADLVIVAKNFASHEMTEKARDWTKEFGKLYVVLPGGYGVNQIINQISLQLVPAGAKKPLVPMKSRAGLPLVADVTAI